MEPMEKPAYYHIKSLEKAKNILDLLAVGGELSVSEIGREVGMHRSAAHRFLATLRGLGLLEQSEDSRYRLSFKIFEWGMSVANRLEIRQIAHPFLVDLKCRHEETVNLGILEGIDVIYVDKIESSHLLRMDLAIGRRVTSYCTALGKVILAFYEEQEVQRRFRGVKFEPRNPNSIKNFPDLLEQLSRIRVAGYAVDDEELTAGITCIAVPVFNYTGGCVGAISMAGPTLRMTAEKIEKVKPDMTAAGRSISLQLGFKE